MNSSAVPGFDLETFYSVDVKAFTDVLSSLERRIPKDAQPQDDEFLQELTAAIHRSRVDCRVAEKAIGNNPQLLKEVQEQFRARISPYFDQSWFMHRARTKPRGYPGDYETLTGIYDGKTKSTGLGGYLDLYFLRSDLAEAVRTRLKAVQKFIVKEVLNRTERVSILNVASGPGREYDASFRLIDDSVHLTCIDTDESALEHLRAEAATGKPGELDLTCVVYNALKTTSSERNRDQFGTPDIIYSVGLCDYIPDRYLVKILAGWRDTVGKDGIVYVAFKDALNYHGAEYQWHVDWHFYERTEDDVRELYRQAGYNVDALEVARDKTRIIMNFVARGAALAQGGRVDQAERVRGPHIRFDRAQAADPAKSRVAE